MRDIFIWIWCFPQMVAGLAVKICTRARRVGDHYEYNIDGGSVSLGNYIFMCPSQWDDEVSLRHEQGHQKQSLYFGWLYLIVIGLPSIIWAGCFEWYRKKYNVSYYSFYTEAWADRLANIKRYQE